jgi:peptidoglycan/LPS O-acetylase OafA/YrhL/cation transport regulator ChaB
VTAARAALAPSRPAVADTARPVTARGESRLLGLDGLRFAAAVAVLLHHYVSRWSLVWGSPPEEVFPTLSGVLAYAAIGPEQFFVISGFVILMTAWGRSVPEVLASRLARLYPAYWAAVVLTSLLLLVFWPDGKPISVGEAAVNLTMFQSLFDIRHVDGVYWTLWVELRFYLLVLVLTAFGWTRRRVLLVGALWAPAAIATAELGLEPWTTLLLGTYAPLFAGGMLLYLIHREGHARLTWLLVAWNVALAVVWQTPKVGAMIERNTATDPSDPLLAALMVGCFAAVAALALTPLRRLGAPWLVTLAALTYPLYLIHEHWGWWVISLAHPTLGVTATLATAVVVAVGLAFAIHHGVERWASPRLRTLVLGTLAPSRGHHQRPAPATRKETPMPKTTKKGEPKQSELPSTVRRSGKKAQRTFAKAHDAALREYGDEERAHRVAYAALKHTHEKVGDRWERKDKGRKGPSDARAEAGVAEAGERASAGGVDANATVAHLRDVAKRLEITGRSRMTKAELVAAIQRENDRRTARARDASSA